MNRILWLLGAAFMTVGIILSTAAGFLWGGAARFEGRALTAEGRVVGLVRSMALSHRRHRSYKPVVVFTGRDGRSRKAVGRLASYPPAYRIGEKVRVLYDPQTPEDVSIGNSLTDKRFPAYIFGGIGMIFDLVGGGFLFFLVRRRRGKARLDENGTLVQATIEEVFQDMHVRMNGKNPWKVRCRWRDPLTGDLRLFISEGMEAPPARYAPGSTVAVLMNPSNPKQYRVMLDG